MCIFGKLCTAHTTLDEDDGEKAKKTTANEWDGVRRNEEFIYIHTCCYVVAAMKYERERESERDWAHKHISELL